MMLPPIPVSLFEATHSGKFNLADYDHAHYTKTIKLKPSQEKQFQQQKDIKLTLDVSPTGNGKNMKLRAKVLHYLFNNPTGRAIIPCPSVAIASEVAPAGGLKMVLDGVEHYFNPAKSTLNEEVDGSVQRVIDFYTEPMASASTNNRTLITTHASLVRAYRRLKETNNLFIIKDCLTCLDEWHHVQGDEFEEDMNEMDLTEEQKQEERETQNWLGQYAVYCINHSETDNISLHGSTATNVRGNRMSILPKELADKLNVYSMTFSEYINEECEHLRSVSYYFAHYRKSPKECLDKIFGGDDFQKTIAYISHGDPVEKERKVNEYLSAIAKGKTKKWMMDDTSITTTIQRGNKTLTGVVLVNDVNRREKYKYIAEAHEGNKPLDFILSLRCFLEGANWKQAVIMVYIGYKKSIVDILQRMGRLTRDCVGKPDVYIFHILPLPFTKKAKNISKKTIAKYDAFYKTIILVLEQTKNLWGLPPLPHEQTKDPNYTPPASLPNLLMDELGDDGDYQSVYEDLTQKLIMYETAKGATDENIVKDFMDSGALILEKQKISQEKWQPILQNFLALRKADVERARAKAKLANLNLGADVDGYDFTALETYKYVGDILFFHGEKIDRPYLAYVRRVIGERENEDWYVRYQDVLAEETKKARGGK